MTRSIFLSGLCLVLASVATGCSESPPSRFERISPDSIEPTFPVITPEDKAASPVFRDVARESGIASPHFNAADGRFRLIETMGSGVGILDYDGDGRQDVFVSQGAPIPRAPGDERYESKLYRNLGNGKFADVTKQAGVGFRGFGQGVAAGDYDKDGRVDLFAAGFGRSVLYRNQGDGSFIDVTDRAGVAGSGWPSSCAFADLDGDGDLDLYVVHYLANTIDAEGRASATCNATPGALGYCPPNVFGHEPDSLYRNNGDGTFTDVSRESGVAGATGAGLGLAIADFDEDGKLDVFIADDQTPNRLFRNLGGLKFEEVALSRGLAYNEAGATRAGMGVAAGDYDNDGKLDLYVTNFYEESSTLYRNLGGGRFQVSTSRARLTAPSRDKLGFGVCFIDYDSDGFLDIFTSNGHINDVRPLRMPYRMRPQLFHNDGQGRFTDVSGSAGPYFAEEHLGRSVAVGDLDGDGDSDLVVSSLERPPAILLNETSGAGRSLSITLKTRGLPAVGARVVVEVGGRKIVRHVVAGGSYLASSDSRLLIGLGDADRADRVSARFLSGAERSLENVEAGRSLVWEESTGPTP